MTRSSTIIGVLYIIYPYIGPTYVLIIYVPQVFMEVIAPYYIAHVHFSPVAPGDKLCQAIRSLQASLTGRKIVIYIYIYISVLRGPVVLVTRETTIWPSRGVSLESSSLGGPQVALYNV